MKRRPLFFLLAGLLVALFALTFGPDIGIFNQQKKKTESTQIASSLPVRSVVRPYVPSRQSLPGQPAVVAVAPVSELPESRSPLADNLNLPAQNASADLSIVYNLLEEYRRAYGAFPTGEDNAQIVNALSGNNRKKLAFLPRNSPAVSSRGELMDRWGSPYFFHILSSQEIEIRSAGPDQELRTADDIVRPARSS